MQTGIVIGTVVATRKDSRLVGHKLMVTQPVDMNRQPLGEPVIAVDTVGAGIGEYVFFTVGTSARYAANQKESPIDAAIVGIIDNMDLRLDVLKKEK